MEDLDHILTHQGEARKNYFNAMAPPIVQTSNFVFDTLDDFRAAFVDELSAHVYTRGNNPTNKILREKLAALEGTEDALVFGSGAAAVAAAVIACVQSGDHIVCVQSPYSWTYKLLTLFLARFGVSHTFVDGRSVAAIEAAIQPNTKLLYLESPSSITFELQDLAACTALAKERNLLTAIDNSYASPIFQQPSRWGIALVIHSGTKYIAVVLGVVCASKPLIQKIFNSEYMTLGAILSPSDAFLAIRGLRTLRLRMERSDTSARYLIDRLAAHPRVERVNYPFASDNPQRALAERQMSGAGGLFSVQLKARNIAEMEAFFHRLERFLLAVSWGGYESLALPFCAFYNVPNREDSTIPWNLVRFYIGLEDPEWLWKDLERALVWPA